MHPAALPDVHGRGPLPAQAQQIGSARRLIDPRAGMGAAALTRPEALLLAQRVQGVIDLAIGAAAGDGDGAGDAVARGPAEPRGRAPAVVVLKAQHAPV